MRTVLLLVLLSGTAFAQASGDRATCGRSIRDRLCAAGQSATATFASSGDAPTCLGDPTCMGFCGVGVYDGGTEWQCVAGPASALGAGTPVAVTQGTAATYAGSPFEQSDAGAYLAASDITDAKAPFIAAAAAQAWLGSTFWGGDHTVTVVAAPTTTDALQPMLLTHGAVSNDGFYMQMNGGIPQCVYWGAGGAQTLAAPTTVLARWSIASCTRTASTYYARSGGSDATAAVTKTAINPATRNVYFGRYTDPGNAIRGPLWRVYFYGAAKSSTELAAIEAGIWGAYTNRGPVTTVRSGTATATLSPDPENLLPYSSDFENWQTDTSGTVTANVAADPDGLLIADRFTAIEPTGGHVYWNSITGTGAYAFAMRLRTEAGTLSGVALKLFDITAGSNACDTGPTSVGTSWVTLSCSGSLVAGHTVFPIVYVSNNGDTLLLAKAQANAGSTLRSYYRTGSTPIVGGTGSYTWGDNAPRVDPRYGILATQAAGDVHSVPTTGMPIARGEISLDFTPQWSGTPPGGVDRRLISTRTSVISGWDFYIGSDGTLLLYGGGSTVGTVAAVTWTTGVTRHLRVAWSATKTQMFVDGVSVLDTTGIPISVIAPAAWIGMMDPTLSTGREANGYIKNLCVGVRCP